MARFKVLKGVAHNVGHSFISPTNYSGNDYVMSHLLRLAKTTVRDTLTIDFVGRRADPPELLPEQVAGPVKWYTEMFWRLVQSSGSDESCVRSAKLTLRFGVNPASPVRLFESTSVGRYHCDVRIVDVKNKAYAAHFEDIWAEERYRLSITSRMTIWILGRIKVLRG
jgi:hypothetical protein